MLKSRVKAPQHNAPCPSENCMLLSSQGMLNEFEVALPPSPYYSCILCWILVRWILVCGILVCWMLVYVAAGATMRRIQSEPEMNPGRACSGMFCVNKHHNPITGTTPYSQLQGNAHGHPHSERRVHHPVHQANPAATAFYFEAMHNTHDHELATAPQRLRQ